MAPLIGPLERRVLEVLWRAESPASVRDLLPSFPGAAYTTLMTTLDRLHRKGLLTRIRRGRAFAYAPLLTRAAFDSARAAEALSGVLQGDPQTLGSVMSFFVDAVSARDRELLDELESLVQSRRAALEPTEQ